MNLAIIILAAGKGTRMESDLAKVLHPLCGKSLIRHVLRATQPLQAERTVVVVGHQAEQVRAEVRSYFPDAEFALQSEMLGTGHAVQQAQSLLDHFEGDIIVTCGDVPLLETATLQKLVEARRAQNAAASLLVAQVDDAGAYGRVLMEDDGRVTGIVEAKDATPEQLAVKNVNAGTYCFEAQALWRNLARITSNNKSGEYYLPDVIGLLTDEGARVEGIFISELEMTGVNTRAQLQELETLLRQEGRCNDE